MALSFFPESSISTDSILIYDMQPEIDAYNGSVGCAVEVAVPNVTITIPATADKVVMVSTNQDNCTQGTTDLRYASTLLKLKTATLYDEVTVIWVTTHHYPPQPLA